MAEKTNPRPQWIDLRAQQIAAKHFGDAMTRYNCDRLAEAIADAMFGVWAPAFDAPSAVALNDDEQLAMESIGRALAIMKTWRPTAEAEAGLVCAIHGVQTFIVQHVLWRLDPVTWSSWWKR